MSENLKLYHDFGKNFEEYLRPLTFPIAIKLIKSEEEIPPDCKQPSSTLKLQNFICQNFKIVRTYGWTMVVTEKDCICKLARAVYGWDLFTEEMAEWGQKFNIGLYAKDLATSAKIQNHLYLLNNEYMGLVISPLTRTKVEPDVVQIYCLPDKPQLIILGNGDRVWGGAEDYEVMFSIPKSKLEMMIDGLEATHKAGLRYPIPKYMNYKPGFQAPFKKRAEKRAGSTLVKEK